MNGEPEIKEWHMHLYWNRDQDPQALAFRDHLIEQVKQRKFIVVCNGINSEIMKNAFGKGFDDSGVPKFNKNPIGPHLVDGSFETWVPRENFAQVLSFFTLNRGNLTVLVHPLTRHEIIDHTERAMWLGKSIELNLKALHDDLGKIPSQYPDLKLGYSSN